MGLSLELQFIDAGRWTYVYDRRLTSRRAARKATDVAEVLATSREAAQQLDEQTLFAALHTCGYKMKGGSSRKPLPAAERVEWARRWVPLRDFLVERNLGLVYTMIRGLRRHAMEWDDLRSEACIALTRAVERFNPWRGFRFSTYGCNVIRRAAIHAVRRENKYRLRFPFEQPTWAEQPLPADAWTDLYVDRLNQALSHNLGELTAREALVLARRFPTDGEVGLTLGQIGEVVGLSKERVRQIQNNALKKLREVLDADPILQ